MICPFKMSRGVSEGGDCLGSDCKAWILKGLPTQGQYIGECAIYIIGKYIAEKWAKEKEQERLVI